MAGQRAKALTFLTVILVMLACTPNTGEQYLGPHVTMFRGNKTYAFMLSWDDGTDDLDFSFLEDLFGVYHTSFVITEQMSDRVLWGLDQLFRGHDIQSHCRSHIHLTDFNSTYVEYLLSQSISDIDKLYGYQPILFAYPYGNKDDRIISLALEYFDVARGVLPEIGNDLGEWPIRNSGNVNHTGLTSNGLPENASLISCVFENMTLLGGNRAFKGYGHTHAFSPEQLDDFLQSLEDMMSRTDTWFTSWGEAFAYEAVRTHTTFSDYERSLDVYSFKANLIHVKAERYPVSVTCKVEVPFSWQHCTVLDGGRISHRVEEFVEDGHRYLLIDLAPRGQRISIHRHPIFDSDAPTVSNLRMVVTDEGILYRFDVIDQSSLIRDVNLTVYEGEEMHFFEKVLNPVFWANSTYGRVLFNAERFDCSLVIDAIDSVGNRVSLQITT
ncbi:MAG: hypothetical protein EAX95_03990 [Candidatus Thorarchaeota archaeon]|nr:hypothetical protein [Candidatus Thorarchaeota archaeon]